MDLSATLSTQETALVKAQVDAFNKVIDIAGDSQTLDKNDFLKLLMAQLTNQDPTDPMKDRDFIAQMAQFSSLEQITNMSQDFSKLAGVLSTSKALGTLGKFVEIIDGENIVAGIVEEVAGRELPRVLVNGRYYDFDKVEKVREQGE